MTDTTISMFFGDGEHSFSLTPPMIAELERSVGRGIGVLCQDVFNQRFSHREIVETIRLGLIGGGLAPQRAHELVATYALSRPLSETVFVAIAILNRLWFGPDAGEQEAHHGQD